MRRSLALAVVGAFCVSGAALAAPGDQLVGNTVLLKWPDGTTGKWWANKDGTAAWISDVKGKVVARNGSWRVQGDRLCLKSDGSPKEICWNGLPLPFGKWVNTKADSGQTGEVELVKGR